MTDPTSSPPTPSRWRERIRAARPWEPEIARLAAAPLERDTLVAALERERGDAWRDAAHLDAGLRRLRGKVFAAVIDRDLGGAADVGEVMRTMTDLAEIAIAEALTFHARQLAERHGVPHGESRSGVDGDPQDLVVVGMGKLGGGELNASSDIDLIFVYPEEGETRGDATVRPIANEDFFTRLARRLIASLAEVTMDGHVFRVDMRLRPDGDSGPLVTRFAMLERYLVTSARDWERFAWVKGRVVSPPVFGRDVAGDLERLVGPFVYRRYLDFGAIDALRKLHGQIRDEATRREATRLQRGGPADGTASPRIDVKLGRGGVREIEFIAQHFQLVRGGRDPSLRTRPTRATLARLVAEGLVEASVGARLQHAYAFLRNVEHRLQYLDDAQTHVVPPREAIDDARRVAAMCAPLHSEARDYNGLVIALEGERRFVEAQFDAIFGDAPPFATSPSTPSRERDDDGDARAAWGAFSGAAPVSEDAAAAEAALRERLVRLGFAPPDDAFGRLTALGRGARVRSLSAGARSRLDALLPRLLVAAAGTAEPSATLGRWFDLVEAIAGRSAYLALLYEFPAARAGVTRLLAASPWAAQYLTRHPILLDELIDAPDNEHVVRDAFAWRAYWQEVAASLARRLGAAAGDAERQMDLLREVHHVETFRLLVDDLNGRLGIEALSDQLSALADLVLDAAVASCWQHFAVGRADAPAWPSFAVIAYGRLGGKELGYASDLDLVFLFEPHDVADAVQLYARFAQRLALWLTARTTAGALFEIDLRLRPDGAAGLVASSIEAWSRYERREHDVGAWTWEHQALTRARFAAGDRALGATFEQERVAILIGERPTTDGRALLRNEIVAMRRRMHDGHPNRSGLFDLKHDDGGMVDIEFVVQYLVLAYGSAHRTLLDNVGNIALLARAADLSLVERADATAAADAYRLYRARQHAIRLSDPQARAARVEAGDYAAERAAVRRLWSRLLG